MSWPAGRVCYKLFSIHRTGSVPLLLLYAAPLAFVLCALVLAMFLFFLSRFKWLMILNIQTLANCDTVDALHFVSAFQKNCV